MEEKRINEISSSMRDDWKRICELERGIIASITELVWEIQGGEGGEIVFDDATECPTLMLDFDDGVVEIIGIKSVYANGKKVLMVADSETNDDELNPDSWYIPYNYGELDIRKTFDCVMTFAENQGNR